MKTHHLKIWPQYFESVISRHKRYELRRNDRDFEIDDHLHLQEWDPGTEKYTGRECTVRVVHITLGTKEPFVSPVLNGYCILGIEPVLDPVDPDRIFVSSHYFQILAIALNEWGTAPRYFEDFSEFLNLLKYGLKANRRDAVLDGLIKEEARMMTDPKAFEL